MLRLYKFFWIVSIVLFLAVLLLVYAFLMDRANPIMAEWGIHTEMEARRWFFYSSLGFFLLVNIILYVLHRILKKSNRHQPDLHRWKVNQEVSLWLLGLAGAVNFSLMAAMGFFGILNNAEDLNLNDYTVLVYLAPAIILLMLIILPLRISRLRQNAA